MPDTAVVLVEATGKKAAFLSWVVDDLGLEGVEVVAARAEDAARSSGLRGAFDVVTARALGPLPVVLELTLPFCRMGGMVVAPRGISADADAGAARGAARLLGGRVRDVETPNALDERNSTRIVVVDKVAPTPDKYPRRAGMPREEPSGLRRRDSLGRTPSRNTKRGGLAAAQVLRPADVDIVPSPRRPARVHHDTLRHRVGRHVGLRPHHRPGPVRPGHPGALHDVPIQGRSLAGASDERRQRRRVASEAAVRHLRRLLDPHELVRQRSDLVPHGGRLPGLRLLNRRQGELSTHGGHRRCRSPRGHGRREPTLSCRRRRIAHRRTDTPAPDNPLPRPWRPGAHPGRGSAP